MKTKGKKSTWRNSAFISWDHRDQPAWDEVSAAAQTGHVFFQEVMDTGSDMYWVVASYTELDEPTAQEFYDAFIKYMDGDES